jgi:hypothetical protein
MLCCCPVSDLRDSCGICSLIVLRRGYRHWYWTKHRRETHRQRLRVYRCVKDWLSLKIDPGAVPDTEPEDALHIAVATMHAVGYMDSWNFAHMVSPAAKFKLQNKIIQLGHKPPIIATPEEIFEEITL